MLFCFVFLDLVFAGGGPLIVDRVFAQAEVDPVRDSRVLTPRRARIPILGADAAAAPPINGEEP